MRFAGILLLVIALCSCASRQGKAKTDLTVDEILNQMMVDQVEAFGWYNSHYDFYVGLEYEVAYPDSAPYPLLDSLFDGQQSRIAHAKNVFDRFMVIWSEAQTRKQKEQPEFVERGRAMADSFRYDIEVARPIQRLFDHICDENKIRKYTMNQFGDSVLVSLQQFEDSLEWQGAQIAALLNRLGARYPDKKSEDYKKYYLPISDMQAFHKVFQTSLIQLENAQSRFYEANPNDFFYTGPFIGERREVVATQQLVVMLGMQCLDFRSKLRAYPGP